MDLENLEIQDINFLMKKKMKNTCKCVLLNGTFVTVKIRLNFSMTGNLKEDFDFLKTR